MSKVKILSILAAILLIGNLVLVWFLMTQKTEHPPHAGPRDVVIEKLSFDADQIKQYDALIEQHREHIRIANQKTIGVKESLYAGIARGLPDAIRDSLICEIGSVQSEIENIHCKHFEELGKLCRPNQQKAFEQLCSDLAALFAPGRPPHGPPHGPPHDLPKKD